MTVKRKAANSTTIRMCGDGQVEGVAGVLRQLDWLGVVKVSQREDGMINITALNSENNVATVAFVASDGRVEWASPPGKPEGEIDA